MNKTRYDETIKCLSDRYNPDGWSINGVTCNAKDNKFDRVLNCFELTKHPHTMLVLVVELNEGEQQQHPDFYRNKVMDIKINKGIALEEVVYLIFDEKDHIVESL